MAIRGPENLRDVCVRVFFCHTNTGIPQKYAGKCASKEVPALLPRKRASSCTVTDLCGILNRFTSQTYELGQGSTNGIGCWFRTEIFVSIEFLKFVSSVHTRDRSIRVGADVKFEMKSGKYILLKVFFKVRRFFVEMLFRSEVE